MSRANVKRLLAIQERRLKVAVSKEKAAGLVFPETSIILRDVERYQARLAEIDGAPGTEFASSVKARPGRGPVVAGLQLAQRCASQREIAGKLGVSQPAVSHWIQGLKLPQMGYRRRIQAIYGVPVEGWKVAAGNLPDAGGLALPAGAAGELERGAGGNGAPVKPLFGKDDRAIGDGNAASRDNARSALIWIRQLRGQAAARGQTAEVVRLGELERRTRMDFARLNGELSESDETRLVRSKTWETIRSILIETARPSPEWMAAIVAALEKAEGVAS